MIPSCLNHRQMTYDFCRDCKNGRDLDCPEYLASIEHNYTRQLTDTENLEGSDQPSPARKLVYNSAEKPFYFGHVELMHNVVLPKSKIEGLMKKIRGWGI